MLTQTQYAVLVGVPTVTIMVAICVMSWTLRRFLSIMHSNFDRLEQQMIRVADHLGTHIAQD